MTATATRESTWNEPDPDDLDPDEALDRAASGLVRLGLIVGLIVASSIVFHVGGAVVVIAAILLMIMLHEFGHFVTARWAGMRVTDFFVGFGPTIWSVKRGDTRYGVKALPFGGFVRVIGMNNLEEVAPEDEPYTYRAKSYWQRVRFACAGTFTHFLIAFVLMVVLLAAFGRVSDSTQPTRVIDDVAPSLTTDGAASPAAKAGLKAGDTLLAVNGVTTKTWDDATDIIQSSMGKPIVLTIERDGRRNGVTVTPIENPAKPGVGMIGVAPTFPATKLGVPAAMWHAGFEIKDLSKATLGSLVGMFSKSSITSYSKQLGESGPADPASEGNRFLSPVGLANLAGNTASQGIEAVLILLILLNIFVGIFNMIPLPPFDGGHVAVATYEAIRSRRGKRYTADMNKLLPVAYGVIMLLVFISVSALWLDIVHPFKLG
ncbi:MAG: hypothetical protein QOF21_1876 [Actinomycetota bacterium]|jgi:membrane-associated protease RseP (regulator of RpoE activity)